MSDLPEPFGVLYEYAPEYGNEKDNLPIRLKEKDLDGIVVQIHTINFLEDEDKTGATLQFNYDVLDGVPSDVKLLEQTLGNLLHDFILQSISSSSNEE